MQGTTKTHGWLRALPLPGTGTLRRDWLGNVRGDLLAGIVVALALIPEAIAFSIIAGVDPRVGLYASFCIAMVTAFVGGRPGMISAATGAMALLMITLVREQRTGGSGPTRSRASCSSPR